MVKSFGGLDTKRGAYLGAVLDTETGKVVSPGAEGYIGIWKKHFERLGRDEGRLAATALTESDLKVHLDPYSDKTEVGPRDLEKDFEEGEIAAAIKETSWKKAPGGDGIKADVIKYATKAITPTLTSCSKKYIRKRNIR